MATIHKTDLAGTVAASLKTTRAQGREALNAVVASIQRALAGGNRVVLTGFGTFEVRQIRARQVRPIRGAKAGQRVTVPAHKRVGFTAGADVTSAVQRSRR
ncbi:MAG: HU family DNA-binding protein [Chloroflexi bacterium]|nr:HU family DNA-binding protein [Chloroflexota bacterium]